METQYSSVEVRMLQKVYTASHTEAFYCANSDHAVYAVIAYLSVSVTSQCSTKTAKHRIMITVSHDSAGILVF